MNRPARMLTMIAGLLVLAGAGVFAGLRLYAWGAGRYWSRGAPEVHLIPRGFEGPVLIIFDPSHGQPPERDGEVRVYRVPATGVLRTAFEPNRNWTRPVYLFADSLGHRDTIPSGSPCENASTSDVVRVCTMNRKFRAPMDGTPDYQAYVVGTRANRLDSYGKVRILIDSLVYGIRSMKATTP